MTPLDLSQSLTHIAEEFDGLRLDVADRLTTPEEAAFLGLIFALEDITRRLTPRDVTGEDIVAQINAREAESLEALRREAEKTLSALRPEGRSL